VDSLVQEPAIGLSRAHDAADIAMTPDFDDFYRSRRDRVARALALTLGDAHLGAEAADEAMTRAYQRWSRVSGYDDPGAWAYRVGLNWATSVLRRRNRAPKPLFDGHAEIGHVAEPTVVAALAALPVNQRAVVICRYYLGLSEAETAAALHIRPGTAKSRLHRALTQLRTSLDHLSPEAFND
jgi:RNA polymerase sigma-70 factor (ECF subfamily)